MNDRNRILGTEVGAEDLGISKVTLVVRPIGKWGIKRVYGPRSLALRSYKSKIPGIKSNTAFVNSKQNPRGW